MSLSSRLERAQQLAAAQALEDDEEEDEEEEEEVVAAPAPAPVPQSADRVARRGELLHEFRLRLQDEVMIVFDSLLDIAGEDDFVDALEAVLASADRARAAGLVDAPMAVLVPNVHDVRSLLPNDDGVSVVLLE